MPKIPIECLSEGEGLHIKSSAQLRFSRNCAPLMLYSQIFHNSKEIIAFTSYSPLLRPKQSFYCSQASSCYPIHVFFYLKLRLTYRHYPVLTE